MCQKDKESPKTTTKHKKREREELNMFIEITKINSYKEVGKALIKTEDVVGIKENHVEPTRLYDDNQNLVSETPNPKDFTMLLSNGQTYHIDETEYTRLVKVLTQVDDNNTTK